MLKTDHLFESINMLEDLQVDRHTSKFIIPFILNCHEQSFSCPVEVSVCRYALNIHIITSTEGFAFQQHELGFNFFFFGGGKKIVSLTSTPWACR